VTFPKQGSITCIMANWIVENQIVKVIFNQLNDKLKSQFIYELLLKNIIHPWNKLQVFFEKVFIWMWNEQVRDTKMLGFLTWHFLDFHLGNPRKMNILI
jgi:IS30 family transposase